MNLFKDFERGVKTFDCLTSRGMCKGYHFDYPDSLGDAEKRQIFEMLYPIALNAFSQDDSEEFKKDVSEHIFSADGLLIVVDEINDNIPVAFRMWDIIDFSVLNGDILYLAGMCVQKEYQKCGVGSVLLNYVLHQDARRQMIGKEQICPIPKCKYVVLRTQNPAMKFYFDNAICDISYPKSIGMSIPDDVKRAASAVARYLKDDHFDSETLISNSLYGQNLYGHKLVAHNKKYERLFSSLNADNGDAIMCVWRRP